MFFVASSVFLLQESNPDHELHLVTCLFKPPPSSGSLNLGVVKSPRPIFLRATGEMAFSVPRVRSAGTRSFVPIWVP